MNDDDDKSEPRVGSVQREERWRRGPASNRFPVRNTAPAGTPVHKTPVTMGATPGMPGSSPIPPVPLPLPLGVPISPEDLGAPPVVKTTSGRPPAMDTITPARTVGGHTARLKVPNGAPDDDTAPRARARVPQGARSRPEDEDE